MVEKSANETAAEAFLLPRQAWQSQIAYLKAILKAKQALDRIEKNERFVSDRFGNW
jgi:hypothetical protein